MRTAYALHFSEGVPVRRIVDTFYNDMENTMIVLTEECDFTWKPISDTKREYVQKVSKPKLFQYTPEEKFHKRLRRDLAATYNWRFEVYAPFSDSL